MMLERARSALILVDYQGRLLAAISGVDAVMREAVFLANVARAVGVPVLCTEQNPERLGPTVPELKSLCDRTLAKMSFDASAEGLADLIRAAGEGIDQVVIAGCEAHVCGLQTALGLKQRGLQVFLVPAASGSRRPEDKSLAMQRLAHDGITLVNGEMVAFEWLGACTDPQFKAVQALIKEQPVN
ncbi:MAG TPA: isochorismatase family protein [Burkholderiaceae bacterium]|nr:isochorismatase family protein [Burkholderiaceae bacterium]